MRKILLLLFVLVVTGIVANARTINALPESGFVDGEVSTNVCINLSVCKENGAFLQVEVKHSPMTRNADEDSLNSIRQKIAQLLIEHFGGTFSIQSEDILFTYPLK